LLGGRDFQTLIDKAGKLREEGYVVEMDIEGNSREDLEQIAQARENCILLYLD
jgi:hypothetical protein